MHSQSQSVERRESHSRGSKTPIRSSTSGDDGSGQNKSGFLLPSLTAPSGAGTDPKSLSLRIFNRVRAESSDSSNQQSVSPDHSGPSDHSREIMQIASLMMNLQYSDELDKHPDQLPHNIPVARNNSVAEYSAQQIHGNMSSATRARAIRAKAKLELKFQIIETFQVNPLVVESDNSSYEVPGCYNPLQTIRNRTAKKEQGKGYSEYLTNKSTKTIWDVDVAELVGDFSWQMRYYRLMRDREGRLLYPEPTTSQTNNINNNIYNNNNINSNSNTSNNKYSGDEFLKRFQSKFSQKLSSTYSRSNSNENSDSSPSRSDISEAEDSKNYYSSNNNHNLLEKPRKPRFQSHISSLDEVSDTLSPFQSLEPQISGKEKMSDRSVSPVRDVQIKNLRNRRRTSSSAKSRTTMTVTHLRKPSITNPSLRLSPPQSRQEDSMENLKINQYKNASEDAAAIEATTIINNSIDDNLTSEPGLNVIQDGNSKSDNQNVSDQMTHSLEELAEELNFLEWIFGYSEGIYFDKPAFYLEKFELNSIESNKICEEIARVCNTTFKELESKTQNFLTEASNEVIDIHKELLTNKAVEMDKMVTESDEIINEISTVMMLELRRLGERLDKVERQSHGLQWMWNMGYMLLEWALVIFMWLVWGFVSSIRMIRNVSKVFVRFIRWLLWL